MKRHALIPTLTALLLLVGGCDESTETVNNIITAPAPAAGAASASATCGQDGDALRIACRDASSDPQSVVVQNGVRFTADRDGSGFQAIVLGSLGQQVLIDVSGGGAGDYAVRQELLDDQGRVVGSNDYSVTVL